MDRAISTACGWCRTGCPTLIEGIANGHPVYIVEGEKDADNGAALGLVTTTTAMGLAGKGHWERGAYDEFFVGADVILVPDQDADPSKGRELARVDRQAAQADRGERAHARRCR